MAITYGLWWPLLTASGGHYYLTAWPSAAALDHTGLSQPGQSSPQCARVDAVLLGELVVCPPAPVAQFRGKADVNEQAGVEVAVFADQCEGYFAEVG